MTRMREVRDVVEAARRLVGGPRRALLVEQLVASTGLSRAGVERALDRHLETSPDEADVERLVAGAAPAESVHVILSANVFVGALRALALAVAAGGDVTVRASRRDPVFAKALVRELASARVRMVDERRVEDIEGGEIHVYGRDATIRAVRAGARDGVVVRGHGSGLGLAWVSACADDASVEAVADDVIAFDQRGCLSPRAVLVEGSLERARGFARALSDALAALGRAIPRGLVPPDVQADASRWRATLAYAGEILEGSDHAVGVAPSFASDALPPTHRHVLVAAVTSLAEAAERVRPIAQAVVTVGSDARGVTGLLGVPWARSAALGAMQRPPLDGPVDLREVARLDG